MGKLEDTGRLNSEYNIEGYTIEEADAYSMGYNDGLYDAISRKDAEAKRAEPGEDSYDTASYDQYLAGIYQLGYETGTMDAGNELVVSAALGDVSTLLKKAEEICMEIRNESRDIFTDSFDRKTYYEASALLYDISEELKRLGDSNELQVLYDSQSCEEIADTRDEAMKIMDKENGQDSVEINQEEENIYWTFQGALSDINGDWFGYYIESKTEDLSVDSSIEPHEEEKQTKSISEDFEEH